ncbi:hypothetical protein Tco_1458819 [Tanacetum coccineum]
MLVVMDGKTKFKDSETIRDFCNEYSNLFKRRNEKDLDESFMDWDEKSHGEDNDYDDYNNDDASPMTDDNPGAEHQNET